MAAQEYFNSFGTGTFAPLPNSPAGYPQQRPPPMSQPPPAQSVPGPRPMSQSSAPPPYTPYNNTASPAPQPQSILKPSVQFMSPPTSSPAPQQQFPVRPPQQQIPQSAYLTADGGALKPSRSYSTPPEYRQHRRDSFNSRSRSSSRSSRESRERRHRHGSRSGHGRDRAGSYSTHDKGRGHKAPHKDMDTFLGAGGGAIIGDAIFPGLGTVGGLLLGGYGGRKYAEKKDRDRSSSHLRREGSRDLRDDGYRGSGRDGDYSDERRSRSHTGEHHHRDR